MWPCIGSDNTPGASPEILGGIGSRGHPSSTTNNTPFSDEAFLKPYPADYRQQSVTDEHMNGQHQKNPETMMMIMMMMVMMVMMVAAVVVLVVMTLLELQNQ